MHRDENEGRVKTELIRWRKTRAGGRSARVSIGRCDALLNASRREITLGEAQKGISRSLSDPLFLKQRAIIAPEE